MCGPAKGPEVRQINVPYCTMWYTRSTGRCRDVRRNGDSLMPAIVSLRVSVRHSRCKWSGGRNQPRSKRNCRMGLRERAAFPADTQLGPSPT